MKNFFLTTLVFLSYLIFGNGLPEEGRLPLKSLNTNHLDTPPTKILSSGTTTYVKTTATGNGSGSDWDNAIGAAGLKSAIESGGTIYVAEGNYFTNEIFTNSNLCLQGGFPNTSTGTEICTYDPIAYPTIIDGQSNNRIFRNSVFIDSLEFKGLVLKNGTASSGSAFISNFTSTQPSVFNFIDLVVESNVTNTTSATGSFSIADKTHVDLKILFQNCLFTNNTHGRGGAININETKNSADITFPNNGNLVIEDCTFSNNTSLGAGGGAVNMQSSNQWTFRRNTFCNNNSTTGDGGAIRFFDSYKIEILDSDFNGNSCLDDGGAINTLESEVFINNSNFVSNTADSPASTTAYGGAIYGMHTGGITIENSGFYSNVGDAGGAIYFNTVDPNQITNCIFISNQAVENDNSNFKGGGAIKLSSSDTEIEDSYFVDNFVGPIAFGGGISIHNSTVITSNNLFYNNLRGTSSTSLGSDIIAVDANAIYSPMQDNKMQLAGPTDYLLQNGSSNPPSYAFSNDTFSNTDDGSLGTAPSISCNTTISPPAPGLACLTTSNCGCPSGATVLTTINPFHTVEEGEDHCLINSVTLANNNITINGTLYIVDGAVLTINDGYITGPNAKIVICENSGFVNDDLVSSTSTNFYNFGWMEICGASTALDTITVGDHSLTSIKTGGFTVQQFAYQGVGNDAFINLNTNSINGSNSGNVCLPGGTPEMVVEPNPSITPICVTDCNGCSELASISNTCNDGSVQAAYNAILNPPIQVCNYTCPGTTGCTYLITGTDSNDYNVNPGEKICLDAGANYTGEIGLFGGTIQNCATAPQSFTYFIDSGSPPSTFNNYGTFVTTGNIPIQQELTINNYATMDLFNLNISLDAVFNNFCTVNVENSIYLSPTGTLNNYGCLDANLNLTLELNSNLTLSGGCLTAAQMFNNGTINGINCGNITISGNSNNTASGSILGNIGFIDLTPPGSAPFIDTNNGTVGGDVVWTSCTSCTDCASINEEICDNGIDDDGDGMIDCADEDCCCAQAPALSKF